MSNTRKTQAEIAADLFISTLAEELRAELEGNRELPGPDVAPGSIAFAGLVEWVDTGGDNVPAASVALAILEMVSGVTVFDGGGWIDCDTGGIPILTKSDLYGWIEACFENIGADALGLYSWRQADFVAETDESDSLRVHQIRHAIATQATLGNRARASSSSPPGAS